MADISQVRVNNTDYNFADDTKVPYDLLQDTVGFTSKNLVKRPYYHGDSRTENGITFTVNADGSIRVQGTPTAVATFTIMHNIHFNNVISTGCPSGSEGTKYKLSYINLRDNDIQYNDLGEGVVIPNDSSNDLYDYRVVIYTAAGNIDVTFYPMLRKADIMDSTYEPYHIPGVVSQEAQNILGVKNLLHFPYGFSSNPNNNGIAVTVNDDGTILCNGTATNDLYLSFYYHNNDYNKPKLFLPAGNYILSGCPSGGSDITYALRSYYYNGTTDMGLGNNYDNGETQIYISDEISQYPFYLQIMIKSGTVLNNLVFKPMLRLADIKDDTWVPHAKTNKELTELSTPKRLTDYLGTVNLCNYQFGDKFKNIISGDPNILIAQYGKVIVITADTKLSEAVETDSFSNGMFLVNLPPILDNLQRACGIIGFLGNNESIIGLQLDRRENTTAISFVKNYTIPANKPIRFNVTYMTT